VSSGEEGASCETAGFALFKPLVGVSEVGRLSGVFRALEAVERNISRENVAKE
jgi:hypothetical protein